MSCGICTLGIPPGARIRARLWCAPLPAGGRASGGPGSPPAPHRARLWCAPLPAGAPVIHAPEIAYAFFRRPGACRFSHSGRAFRGGRHCGATPLPSRPIPESSSEASGSEDARPGKGHLGGGSKGDWTPHDTVSPPVMPIRTAPGDLRLARHTGPRTGTFESTPFCGTRIVQHSNRRFRGRGFECCKDSNRILITGGGACY